MRLWSLHPSYLDRAGLTAVWREALLAKKVLENRTTGYRHHPQLQRFRQAPLPLAYLNAYLLEIWREAHRRGYHFQSAKIDKFPTSLAPLPLTTAQVAYEFQHLMKKLRTRAPAVFAQHSGTLAIRPHPLFTVIPGPLATWEKTQKA